jgi:hypothetical protein
MCINSAKYIIIVAHSCQECEEKYFYDKHVKDVIIMSPLYVLRQLYSCGLKTNKLFLK